MNVRHFALAQTTTIFFCLIKLNRFKKPQEDNPLNDKREAEFKFEWQKNAPREKYLKGQTEGVTDQPFGIAVKNVKCLKVRYLLKY